MRRLLTLITNCKFISLLSERLRNALLMQIPLTKVCDYTVNFLKHAFFFIISLEIINFLSLLYSLHSVTVGFLQLFLILLIVSNIFKKFILFTLLKRNLISKSAYKKTSLIRKNTSDVFFLLFSSTLQWLLNFYKEYPFVLLIILVVYSYLFKTFFLLPIFCCHWFYDTIIEEPYFKEFKKKRAKDIQSFNFHWNFDRDLVFLNKCILSLYSIGFLITYFSYFIYYTSLGELGLKYTLYVINYTISIRDIQYFLSMNLVGPIILSFCIALRFFLNLHVIFFRNPSTVIKNFAVLVTSKNTVGLVSFVLSFTGVSLGFNGSYHAGVGPQFTIKNTVDSIYDGVVRHTQAEENAFQVVKKYGFNIKPTDIIVEGGSKRLDLSKFHVELGLEKNSQSLDRMSASELKSLGFVDLISDTKLLRHNLNVYCNLDNGTTTMEDYIVRCNKRDTTERLVLGIDPPSKLELHAHYKKVTSKLCDSPKNIEIFQRFLKGESDEMVRSFKFQKEFGIFSSQKNWDSSVYVNNSGIETKSSLEIIAENIPKILLEKKQVPNINFDEQDTETLGKTIPKERNKQGQLLIKNEPENP